MSVDQILEQVCKIAIAYGAKTVYLFGSRATGKNTERSDIDLAVSGITNDFEEFEEEIQNIKTLLRIDVVDLEECYNQLLMEDIKQYGRKIYEKV